MSSSTGQSEAQTYANENGTCSCAVVITAEAWGRGNSDIKLHTVTRSVKSGEEADISLPRTFVKDGSQWIFSKWDDNNSTDFSRKVIAGNEDKTYKASYTPAVSPTHYITVRAGPSLQTGSKCSSGYNYVSVTVTFPDGEDRLLSGTIGEGDRVEAPLGNYTIQRAQVLCGSIHEYYDASATPSSFDVTAATTTIEIVVG